MTDHDKKFEKLLLNQEKIPDALQSLADEVGGRVVGPTVKGHSDHYEILVDGREPALLMIFKRRDGRVTLGVNGGRNKELTVLAAERVAQACRIEAVPRSNLVLPHVSKESVEALVSYLKADCGAESSEEKFEYGIRYQLRGKQRDRITITSFHNGRFMVQGTNALLHAQAVEFLTELVDNTQLIAAQLKMINVDVSSADILEELKGRLPTSYDFLGGTIVAILSPAIALDKLKVELTDYSAFAIPALRALEGYLKRLLLRQGLVVGKDGFKPYLREDGPTLNDNTRAIIACEFTCKAFNRCYDYYRRHRHGLTHVDGSIASTRIIDRQEEAREIVFKTLELIETSFAEIP